MPEPSRSVTETCTIESGDDRCASLKGPLTFESVPGLFAQARSALTANLARIDLSGITAADSAGLALLLEWQAARKNTAETLTIINAPSSLMSLASLSEATELLNISGRNPEDV